VILFITCVAAVLGLLAMGALSDYFGDAKYGFVLATAFAALLFMGLLLNWIFNPAGDLLRKLDLSEYEVEVAEPQTFGAQV
jgi:flagellar motor component MotA